MGLDITFKQRKNFVCPDCGKIVGSVDVLEETSGGRVWYEFLQNVGYYTPNDMALEEKWYGKDMVLTREQVEMLGRFVKNKEPYAWYAIYFLLSISLAEGHDVVINADW